MFQATMCQSSQETTVFMRHLVLVIQCGWTVWYAWVEFHPAYQTVIHTEWIPPCIPDSPSTLNNKHQVSHKYSCFSSWWAHGRPKHVEKRNKHPKKNCAPSWLYLQDFTGMYGEHNIKSRENMLIIRLPKSNSVCRYIRTIYTHTYIYIYIYIKQR